MIKENSFYIKQLKNVVFLGYSDLLSKFIDINNNLKINTFVITSPDQNKKLDKIKKKKVFKNLNSFFRSFIKKNFDIEKTIFISISSRWIFKKSTINFFKNNLINFHSSRLPFDRGGATFSWQILKGDRIHSNTAHLVDEGVDTGPIIFSRNTIYPYDCKIPLDFEIYDKKQLEFFYQSLVKKIIKEEKLRLCNQNNNISSYNPRINSVKDSWIDWNLKPEDLIKFINAFDEPYEGAKTLLNGKIVRLKSAQISSAVGGGHPFMSGIISNKDKDWITINLYDGKCLIVERILNEKNENILKNIKIGDRFFTDSKKLAFAKSIRSKFNTLGLKKK